VLETDLTLSRHIELTGRLDCGLDEISVIAQYIPAGAVVVNAGAALGDHACVYSQLVGAIGHVYAYEPHPLYYHALTLNMARFTNVTTFNVALGSEAAIRRYSKRLTRCSRHHAIEYDECDCEQRDARSSTCRRFLSASNGSMITSYQSSRVVTCSTWTPKGLSRRF